MEFPHLQQIYLECGKEEGTYPAPAPIPHAEVLLPSEPVSQYRYINLPKTDDNDRTYKNDANTLS